MSELGDRLIRCFDSIFDGLSPDQIRSASVKTLPAWDSLASVTLMAILEQEFNVQIDPFDLPHLTFFPSVHLYIKNKLNTPTSTN